MWRDLGLGGEHVLTVTCRSSAPSRLPGSPPRQEAAGRRRCLGWREAVCPPPQLAPGFGWSGAGAAHRQGVRPVYSSLPHEHPKVAAPLVERHWLFSQNVLCPHFSLGKGAEDPPPLGAEVPLHSEAPGTGVHSPEHTQALLLLSLAVGALLAGQKRSRSLGRRVMPVAVGGGTT